MTMTVTTVTRTMITTIYLIMAIYGNGNNLTALLKTMAICFSYCADPCRLIILYQILKFCKACLSHHQLIFGIVKLNQKTETTKLSSFAHCPTRSGVRSSQCGRLPLFCIPATPTSVQKRLRVTRNGIRS